MSSHVTILKSTPCFTGGGNRGSGGAALLVTTNARDTQVSSQPLWQGIREVAVGLSQQNRLHYPIFQLTNPRVGYLVEGVEGVAMQLR